MEALNWIGNAALAFCALPLALQAYKNKHIDISLPFLFMWSMGELFVAAYVISIGEWALTLNYICNIICLCIVWIYRNKDVK